jgi:hypothetical protein
MESLGTWSVSATSPLGKESYVIGLNDDGSGSISHDKGVVEFAGAIINTAGDTIDVDLCGHTDIPMSVDFHCKFQSIGKILKGFVEIDKYVTVEINGVKV